MDLSIVIPVLNEELNIDVLCDRLTLILQSLVPQYEILFVDDGSNDETLKRITARHRTDPRVKALSFSRRFGHQHALTAGLDHAKGAAVITMDGDLQHPPEHIPELLKLWKEGNDIVFTVRRDASIFSLKTFFAQIFYPVFVFFSGVNIPSRTADFRLMSRRVVDAFDEIRERTRFMRGLSAWVGYRRAHFVYSAPPRQSGKTKYSFSQMIKLGADALLSFSTVPLYAGVFIGFAMCILVLAYVCFALYARFITHRVLAGWTSMAILIGGVGSLQIMLTGIVGLYLAKVYEESKQRPLYLIKDYVGIENIPEDH